MIFSTKSIMQRNIKALSRLSCEVGQLPRFIPNHKLLWQSSGNIRSRFIEYFIKYDHKFVAPCSLNSKNIGSYFVNSGVSQFKDHILGLGSEHSGVRNAVNSQRCVRLGGKVCDLTNIGYDSSHLSYFEMLGNWSFGSYDKKEACKLMWRFLTEELQLPASHLYVTYFGGSDKLGLPPDYETRDIWFSLGVKDSKVLEFGEEHNFWEMGGDRSLNPLCGPSTEIHWDYLATMGDYSDPRCARCFVNSTSTEVSELWNCVFMEYRWTNGGKTLTKLPKLIIDTGMGLERLASIVQGTCGVFDTDLFKGIIDHLSNLSKCPPYEGTFSMEKDSLVSKRLNTDIVLDSNNRLKRDVAYRIISDHLRALTICVNDNILPGREHSALKVRQLLQRAIRQSKVGLGMSGGLSQLIDTICETLSSWHVIDPLIIPRLKAIIDKEESNFLNKVDANEKSFAAFLKERDSKNKELNESEIRSLLNGTFGEKLSLDMIRAMSQDADLKVKDFLQLDGEPSDSSIQVAVNNIILPQNLSLTDNRPAYNYEFNPDRNIYEVKDLGTSVTGVVGIGSEGWTFFDKPASDHSGGIFGLLTERTNMFATKGGQECDTGLVLSPTDQEIIATVESVTELDNGHIIHWCRPVGPSRLIRVSDKIVLRVDNDQRTGTTLHHTAHHIVFSVLNKLLGRVYQASSSVNFNHAKLGFSVDIAAGDTQNLSSSDLAETLERKCLEVIKGQVPVEKKENIPFSQVLKDPSVRYLKSENLPNDVRLVSIGDSVEVCCGTHADNTGHLQDIVITSLKNTNQTTAEVSFVVGKEAVEIRSQDKILRNLCSKIDQIPYNSLEEVNGIVKVLNTALGRQTMSKCTRELLKKAVNTAAKLKIEAPGVAEVLVETFSSDSANFEGVKTLNVNITSTKKAVLKIIDLNLSPPIILYDHKKLLIFSLRRNLSDFLRESLSEFLKNTSFSVTDIVMETPKVRNISDDVLCQFVSVSLPERFEDCEGLVAHFSNMMK